MTASLIGEAHGHRIAVAVMDNAADVRSWGDAVVVTSGWTTAERVMGAIDAAPDPPTRGAFLAPWLLGSAVTGGPGRVQVAMGLPFDPSSSTADSYLAQLARRAPGATASATGFAGWLARRGDPPRTPTAIQFFTPARIEFLPPSLSEGHDHGGASWVQGGRMAAVSGLVHLST
jgi:hypothetical protein